MSLFHASFALVNKHSSSISLKLYQHRRLPFVETLDQNAVRFFEKEFRLGNCLMCFHSAWDQNFWATLSFSLKLYTTMTISGAVVSIRNVFASLPSHKFSFRAATEQIKFFSFPAQLRVESRSKFLKVELKVAFRRYHRIILILRSVVSYLFSSNRYLLLEVAFIPNGNIQKQSHST